MSEETPTPPDQLPQEPLIAESDEVYEQPALELNQNLRATNSTESAPSAPTKQEKKGFAGTPLTGKEWLAASAAAATAITGVSLVSSGHMDTVLDNMSGQVDPNQHHDFENGPLPPEDTEAPGPMNPTESPAPNEIPSPGSNGEIDVQLPTVPNEGTEFDK